MKTSSGEGRSCHQEMLRDSGKTELCAIRGRRNYAQEEGPDVQAEGATWGDTESGGSPESPQVCEEAQKPEVQTNTRG